MSSKVRPGLMLRKDLTDRADDLRARLEEEEVLKDDLRQQGRNALSLADTLLSSVEQSLQNDGGGSLTARAGRAAVLPPITRPDSAA